MVRSAYEALYKVVMNINEDSHWPHGCHSLDGDRCIKHDTPTHMMVKKALTHAFQMKTAQFSIIILTRSSSLP